MSGCCRYLERTEGSCEKSGMTGEGDAAVAADDRCW